jgi:hypothetical protein
MAGCAVAAWMLGVPVAGQDAKPVRKPSDTHRKI